jgi:hypothetical protein
VPRVLLSSPVGAGWPCAHVPNLGHGLNMSHPIFKLKLNARMCAQKLSLHTYRIENGYRITNVTIYNIFTK